MRSLAPMIPLHRRKLHVLPILALLAGQSTLNAQANAEDGFQGYVQLLAARARSEGVTEASIQRLTWGLTLNPRVIELDRGQPGIAPVPPPIATTRKPFPSAAGRSCGASVSGK